ncbi:nucleotide sugar dehydrogenase [Alphaproteobacteria bacterium]|nr:nucleotide sugar dehydrogenase [Alphaproteobacteria bacterium]
MFKNLSKSPYEKSKICVVGLGYVGLPLAIEFGKIRPVVGFDIDEKRIEELKSGIDITKECGPDDFKASKNLSFTSIKKMISDCEIYIITVPTPVDSSNRPNLEPLMSASKTVGKHLEKNNIVIYESTIFPGATEEICVPILEETSSLKYNDDFFCGYSPERINPGDKINTLPTIKKVVSGSTPEIAKEIDILYGKIIKAGTHLTSNIKVAEASKVIENSQRDLNIAFVNELSVIFERLDIDTLEVLEAAGTKWNFLPFRPGMVGGHCIGVDPYYLTHKAEQIGYNPQIILAGRRMNDNMARYAARNIIKKMAKRGINLSEATVGILGVTFKDNCPDIRNSKIFDLLTEFGSWGIKVKASDPWADHDQVYKTYGIELYKEIPEKSCDALVVAVAHHEFSNLTAEDLSCLIKEPNKAVLGDLKSLYNKEACKALGFDVFRL